MSNSSDSCTNVVAGADENVEKYKLLEKRASAQHVPPNSIKSTSDRLREALSMSGDVYRHHSANTIFKLGEKGSDTRSLGAIQDFHQLRQECLSKKVLFEDPEFPAQDLSIYPKNKPTKFIKEFEWKRPMEIIKSGDVKLFVDGFSRFDVIQGLVGDCWFIAGIANLAMHPNIFTQVVPEDQSFHQDEYAGIFHFRFWQYGRWIDVVIDDRLPMFEGKLLFARSPEDNEFWSPLLEKAYAKLHGSYEALVAGHLEEVVNDFTGRVAEIYLVDDMSTDFFKFLLEAQEKGAIMGCAGLKEKVEGLADRHQYSITRLDYVKYVDKNNPNHVDEIPLVRLRNPGGGNSVNLDWLGFVMKEGEWEGPWGDKSPEWDSVSIEEKTRLGFMPDLDGEFWMSFQDFKRYFTMFDICRASPNALMDSNLSTAEEKWEMSAFEGEWVRGETAGGFDPEEESFWKNPQYRIMLESPAKDDDDCTVIVALKQKFQTRMDTDSLHVGFVIYHLKDPDSSPKPLDAKFARNNEPLDIDLYKENKAIPRSLLFLPMEVSCRIKLPPGPYCIIPSTFGEDDEGKFLLRVYSEKPNNMEEYCQQVGFGETDDRVVQRHLQLNKIEEELLKSFRKHAGNEADWKKLKLISDSALCKEKPNNGFSEDVCHNLVDLMDKDGSGKLGFKEFEALCKDIAMWQVVFSLYDTDGLDYLRTCQLKEALSSAGYRLNHHVMKILLPLYEKDGKITFNDFIMCAALVKTSLTSERN